MPVTLNLVDGWTGPLDFQLLADGAAVDLTGTTVTLVLVDKDGTTVDTTGGKVTVPTPAEGKVRFAPGASDLDDAKSPYRARWKVTDGGGKIVYFPGEIDPDGWHVWKVT